MISQRIELSEFTTACVITIIKQMRTVRQEDEKKVWPSSPNSSLSFPNSPRLLLRGSTNWLSFFTQLFKSKIGILQSKQAIYVTVTQCYFWLQPHSLNRKKITESNEEIKSVIGQHFSTGGAILQSHIGLLTCQHVSQIAERIMRMLKQSAHWSFTGTQTWHNVKNGFNH